MCTAHAHPTELLSLTVLCRLIQEFEREARTDGMPTRELADRKRKLVNQFNTYVNLKKQHSTTEAGRGELLAGAAPAGQEEAASGSATDGMCLLGSPLRISSALASVTNVSCTISAYVCQHRSDMERVDAHHVRQASNGLCAGPVCRHDNAGAHERRAQRGQGD